MESVAQEIIRTDSSCDELSDDWLAVKSDAFVVNPNALEPTGGADGPADTADLKYRVCVSPGSVLSDVQLHLIENEPEESSSADEDDDDDDDDDEREQNASRVCSEEVCTFSQLEERHSTLSTLFPAVECLLPHLPREPSGFWSFFTSIQVESKTYTDLEIYFSQVLRFCGVSVLKDLFFTSEVSAAEGYMEELGEIRRQQLMSEVDKDKAALESAYRLHERVTDLQSLQLWHSCEDKALEDLERSERHLFKFSCRPFSDLQVLASCGREQALLRSLDQDLTLTARAEAAQEESSLTQDMIESKQSLFTLECSRYTSLAQRTQDCIRRMLQDKDAFCRTSALDKEWCANGSASRLRLLERRLVTCSVDLLRVRCHQLQVQKEEVLLAIACLSGDMEEVRESVHRQEKLFYELHLHLLDTHMALLDEREKQIKFWVEDLPPSDNLRRQRLLAKEATLATQKSRRRVERRNCERDAKALKLDIFSHTQGSTAQTALSKIVEVRDFESKAREEQQKKAYRKACGRVREFRTKNYKAPEVLPPRYQPPSIRNPKPPRTKTQAQATTSPILNSTMASLRVAAPKASLLKQQTATKAAAASPAATGKKKAIRERKTSPGTSSSSDKGKNTDNSAAAKTTKQKSSSGVSALSAPTDTGSNPVTPSPPPPPPPPAAPAPPPPPPAAAPPSTTNNFSNMLSSDPLATLKPMSAKSAVTAEPHTQSSGNVISSGAIASGRNNLRKVTESSRSTASASSGSQSISSRDLQKTLGSLRKVGRNSSGELMIASSYQRLRMERVKQKSKSGTSSPISEGSPTELQDLLSARLDQILSHCADPLDEESDDDASRSFGSDEE